MMVDVDGFKWGSEVIGGYIQPRWGFGAGKDEANRRTGEVCKWPYLGLFHARQSD